MAKKSVNDPGSLGWTDDGNGFWSWSGDGDGSDCAGMVVSATEPTDPIEGMQWLNSDTAEVFIFDGAVWLEFPAGSGGSGGGLWEANGNDIYYSDGNVGIGMVPENTTSALQVFKNSSNSYMSVKGNHGDVWIGGGEFNNAIYSRDLNTDPKGFQIVASVVGIGMEPEKTTFDLSAKEQLKEWKTKAKKASWEIVTDGEFSQEPAEELVEQWIETRAAGDRLQVDGNISATGKVTAPITHTILAPPGTGGNWKGGGYFFNNNFIPCTETGANSHGTHDLGQKGGDAANTFYWKNAYFSGDVNAGELFLKDANPRIALDSTGTGEGYIDNWYVGGTLIFRTSNASKNDTEALKIAGNGNASFSGGITCPSNMSVGGALVANGYASENQLRVRRSSSLTGSGAGISLGTTYANTGVILYGTDNQDFVVSKVGDITLANPSSEAGYGQYLRIGTTGATFYGTVTVEGNRPVSTKLDLITTLTTLRKATMDETQDIRESLRSAIDELVAGFEQEIAAMPAPEPEVSTMPAGDSE